MTALTVIDSKIGEVLGLAMAAKDVTQKVQGLVEDAHVAKQVRMLHDDSKKIERMGTELISSDTYAGKKTAILDQARETRHEATEMANTYLGDDADALDGFEFLTMSEAGEFGHLEVLATLNHEFGDRELQEFLDFVLPMEEKHVHVVRDGLLTLTAQEQPTAPA